MEFIFSKFMHRSTKSSVNQAKQIPEKQQQCVSPKMSAEKQDDLNNQQFTDFSKENITNPKSLSEIATETTSKLSAAIPHDLNVTKTSTPKYLKSRDKILDEDSNESFANIRPAYRQLNMNDSHKADDSLGFLTEGLCNLGLDEAHKLDKYDDAPVSNNLTLSDDEFVECQSFSNFNSYPRTQQNDAVTSLDSSARTFDFTKSALESNFNVTVPSENVLPVAAKDSFRFAQQNRQNDSYSLDASHDDRSLMNINDTTRTVDHLEDMERVLEQNLSTQDNGKNERTSEGSNKTINDIESKFPDVLPGSSVNANVTFEQETINTTTELLNENLQKDVLIGSTENQNVTFEQETVHVKTEVSNEYMSPVPNNNVVIPNICIEHPTPENKSRMMSSEDDSESSNSAIADIAIRIKQEVEIMEVDQQDEEEEGFLDNERLASEIEVTPTRGFKDSVNDNSVGHQSPSVNTEIEMKEVIMRNIQKEIEEEFKMAQLNEFPHDKTLTDGPELIVDNSNQQMFINRDSLANMFNNTFEQERVPVDVTLNQGSSVMSPTTSKGKQMNFMDAIDNNFDVEFKVPSLPQSRKSGDMMSNGNGMNVFAGPKGSIDVKDEVFKSAGSTFQFAETDFDFLQNREDSSKPWEDDPRNSILLKFDPLLRKPVPVLCSEQLCNRLSGTKEEDDELIDIAGMNSTQTIERTHQVETHSSRNNSFNCNRVEQKSMVDVAESLIIPLNNVSIMNVDAMKDLINTSGDKNIDVNHYECTDIKKTSNHNEQQGHKIVEMENRIKNEVLKGEDSENKLKEAEMREEALLKRITEKDKTIVKMSGVVEAYEKAISELVAEKEQLLLKSEKMCADLKHDGEMNAQHLSSLETTFSDLHAKYERTKQLAAEQKEREDGIMQEKKLNADNLKMQEMRYEKMKTHAMTQLEIANTKLSDLTRNHAAELTKLRAQLKKEEISRASMSEQLLQKTKENAELVKICDELINGQS